MVVSTASQQYPVSFSDTPKICHIEGVCLNATLTDDIGENLTVVLFAWIQNATTGQNVTMLGGGKNSLAAAGCQVHGDIPSTCYLVAYVQGFHGPGIFRVKAWVMATDGRTILSQPITVTLNYGPSSAYT